MDDDEPLLNAIGTLLTSVGHDVTLSSNPLEAVQRLDGIEVVLSDILMPHMDGLELLRHIKARTPEIQVVFMTGFGSIKSAMEAIRAGAYDYFTKPFDDVHDVFRAVGHALEKSRLEHRARELSRQLDADARFAGMTGESAPMQAIFRLVNSLAATESTVLIRGETGTGKELVARAIHLQSQRRARPFVAVNCSAFAETLIDSELFGHAKGAFTGAQSARRGLFETADGGTLFLDEIGDIPAATQVRLLRALEEGAVRPVGGDRELHVNVRVVAATHVDLKRAIAEGKFREDLFYRLNVLTVDLPALRDRMEDVPLLARTLLARACARIGKEAPTISGDALGALLRHNWPGNVRELQNAMERAAALARGEVRAEDLPAELSIDHSAGPAPHLDENALYALPYAEAKRAALQDFEQRYLAARMSGGASVSAAARAAGMDRSNFRRLLKASGMHGDDNEG